MELGLLIIFWYGVLHAFGPDHLTAIADFSIGKSRRRTLMITFGFALAHGVSLFVFAKLLQSMEIPQHLLDYGDVIASSVIIGIGVYLLWMVASDRIQFHKHMHGDKEHIHIWFGKQHSHHDKAVMGSSVSGQAVSLWMVVAFASGVLLIFMLFGLLVAWVNGNLLSNKTNVRRAFALAGLASVVVGGRMLLG